MTVTMKNTTPVLHEPHRFMLVAHLMKRGQMVVTEAAELLGFDSYSAADRHIGVLRRANVVAVSIEPHPSGLNRSVKTLTLTDTGRRAFEAQRRAFRELAAA
jgi:DNA-binding MarR family transcriptional regulator